MRRGVPSRKWASALRRVTWITGSSECRRSEAPAGCATHSRRVRGAFGARSRRWTDAGRVRGKVLNAAGDYAIKARGTTGATRSASPYQPKSRPTLVWTHLQRGNMNPRAFQNVRSIHARRILATAAAAVVVWGAGQAAEGGLTHRYNFDTSANDQVGTAN